ncbi:uncharacterized protein LOC120679627 [Panicum virgatum]|uniref:KIB1-4 beta-propeller domain-containing protein n=1 Tax=Panicum virgatum TaxID=38727 RepID=A0A8T0R3K5_PANVG|nr:uncharacterized protein LOC120679627 [Panicum virgatum]KAG2579820.1 hypothetical protein PVAP13_6NG351400 [Panicum virgatum]
MIPCSKLRRLTRSAGAGAGEVSPDWASLGRDLVELIGWRVLAGDLQDYVRFRAVCAHWSTSTAAPRGRGVLDPRFHPRRWMMLPEGHGLYPGHPDLGGFVRFFNLSTGAFVRAHLPLLDDHVVLDSVDGLLLLHRDHDTAIRVLHPFTGDVAELPPLASLLPQIEPDNFYSELNKRSKLMRVCTSITASSTGAITVMLVLDLLHRVAHATTGDQRWTLSAWNLKPLIKPVSFQGKLYAFQPILRMRKVYIYKINPPCPNANEGPSHLPLPEKIAECPLGKFIYMLNYVECGSELLLVAYSDASHSRLVVCRFADLVGGKNEPVTSIGDNALFIDERCLCVSVSPNKGSNSLSSISPNSIICCHSLPGNPGFVGLGRFGQDLGTGIWTPASDGDICQRPPPSPHTLIHHILLQSQILE